MPAPTVRLCLPALLLAACGPGEGAGAAGIDTTDLWPVDDGAVLVYRHLDAGADTEPTDVLDESDLLWSRYEVGGCGDWRAELRTGASWAEGAAAGALHFEDGLGLAICGVEDADGTLAAFEAPVSLWIKGSVLDDGGTVESGARSASARRVDDVATYFGVFPQTIAFTLTGDGVEGWELHLADGFGLVLLATDGYTADLVYTR